MTKKSSSVSRPLKAKQTKGQQVTRGKSAKRATESKSNSMDLKRQIKIQKALYEIADAASAVKDMQSFYKKLHRIIGKLMYAENFFIARYDEHARMVYWEYVVDVKDQGKSIWQSQPLNDENKTSTTYVIRSGKMIRRQDIDSLIAKGELKVTGALPIDGIGIPLKSGKKVLGALALQSYKKGYYLFRAGCGCFAVRCPAHRHRIDTRPRPRSGTPTHG
jgi:transcriptional regulator with GAF, ATPase, and Fis domain